MLVGKFGIVLLLSDVLSTANLLAQPFVIQALDRLVRPNLSSTESCVWFPKPRRLATISILQGTRKVLHKKLAALEPSGLGRARKLPQIAANKPKSRKENRVTGEPIALYSVNCFEFR